MKSIFKIVFTILLIPAFVGFVSAQNESFEKVDADKLAQDHTNDMIANLALSKDLEKQLKNINLKITREFAEAYNTGNMENASIKQKVVELEQRQIEALRAVLDEEKVEEWAELVHERRTRVSSRTYDVFFGIEIDESNDDN